MIKFLNKKTILVFHQNQIETYGGSKGIRDKGLLESALAQPQASFGGEYVHEDIFEMAAAYGYHICQNHPFYDGNKRTALIAIYTFLYANGYRLQTDKKRYCIKFQVKAYLFFKEVLVVYRLYLE